MASFILFMFLLISLLKLGSIYLCYTSTDLFIFNPKTAINKDMIEQTPKLM